MSSNISFFGWAIVMLVPGVLLGIWVAYLMRVRIPIGLLLTLGVSIAAGFMQQIIYDGPAPQDPTSIRWYLYHQLRAADEQPPLTALSVVICANLAIALAAKVYRAIAMNKQSDSERAAGLAGVRAWLAPVNVVSVIVLAVCAWYGINYSFAGVLILGLALLLLPPLIAAVSTHRSPLPVLAAAQAPSDERQRVLALVEAGKITAEDAAELMSALAQSQVAEVQAAATLSTPLSGPRRAIIAGASVVLVGFMLPWFSVNLSAAIDSARNMVQQSIPQMPQPFPTGFNLPQQTGVTTNSITQIQIHGGDVQNGLGWITLAAACVTAALPVFWSPRLDNAQQQRSVVLVSLAVGSVAVLYLLANSFNPVTTIEPGFMLSIAGYALLGFGAIREYVASHPMFHPAVGV